MTKEDKALGYWCGKCLGVTLGLPYEGHAFPHSEASMISLQEQLARLPESYAGDDDTTVPLALVVAVESDALNPAEIADVCRQLLPEDWFWGFYTRLRHGMRPPETGQETEWGGDHIGGMILADTCRCLDIDAAAVASIVASGQGVEAARLTSELTEQPTTGLAENTLLEQDLGFVADLVAAKSLPGEAWQQFVKRFEMRELESTVLPSDETPPEPWVLARPNLALVAFALWQPDLTPVQKVALCARLGWDADSNAGMVGGLLGLKHGPEPFLESWPGLVESPLPHPLRGVAPVTVGEAAARTAKLI